MYSYTMDYFSAIKNKDSMNYSGKWMALENIILSEEIQSQKEIHDMHSFIKWILTIT